MLPVRRAALTVLLLGAIAGASELSPLPERDGSITLLAQEWPYRPGPRTVRVYLHYPGGALKNVGPRTGLMLSLHNWGGTAFVGAADPRVLAERFDVVAIGVDYLQSGAKDSIEGPEPYDHGWLQALDALRALHHVFDGLRKRGTPFATDRIFATGGSGGGNVTRMANKLAPRTFACVVDMCGMKRLSDDVAFHLPGGSDLNARYSRDPHHRHYLPPDEQEIRHVGHAGHLAVMRTLGSACQVVVVHGVDDVTCPFADAEACVAAHRTAGLPIEAHFIRREHLDGKVFTGTGHALGNRTEMVAKVAGKYLAPNGPDARKRTGPSDFERRETVRYPTVGGAFVIDYTAGPPVGHFEPGPPTGYSDHTDITFYLDATGARKPLRSPDDWRVRRGHILSGMQAVMGPLPHPARRVPLEVRVLEEMHVGDLVRRKISYASEPGDRVPAWLFLPAGSGKKPAVLCLHQTTPHGKGEPAGLGGDASLHYALHLARRGYVTLAPDYPSFGEHPWDFAPQRGYASGSMKAVWDNMRAVDLLRSLPEVDGERLGVLGHSLGGHNALFTAAFDERLAVVVSSCGFTRFGRDDMPSWTGPRYMPRIAARYGNRADRMPFDFPEIIAALAPRPFLTCSATRDNDFDVVGVRESLAAARRAYEVFGRADHLVGYYPEAGHGFPADARERADAFLDRHLKRGKP